MDLLKKIREDRSQIAELMVGQDETLEKLSEEVQSLTTALEELRAENEDLKQQLHEATNWDEIAEEEAEATEVSPTDEAKEAIVAKSEEAKEVLQEEEAEESEEESSSEEEFDETDFRAVALRAHNDYRAKHNAPPLRLDDKLNNVAQAYARRLAQMNQLVHSQNGYGENLYGGQGGGTDAVDAAKKAVRMWYDEIKYYNWNNPGFSMQTGHFSQVVWKSSTALGIGVASNSNGCTYVCANYSPPGNYQGQYRANVSYPK